jgi:hypothetical protein
LGVSSGEPKQNVTKWVFSAESSIRLCKVGKKIVDGWNKCFCLSSLFAGFSFFAVTFCFVFREFAFVFDVVQNQARSCLFLDSAESFLLIRENSSCFSAEISFGFQIWDEKVLSCSQIFLKSPNNHRERSQISGEGGHEWVD